MLHDLVLWGAMVLLFALLLLFYLLNLWLALTASSLGRWWRLLVWIPPLAVLGSWRGGHRFWSLLWGATFTAYCVLRVSYG